jgi:hypothetical protein
MKNPILAAERQRRRLERLRKQLVTTPRQAPSILATKLGQWPKRAATIAKIQKLEEMEAKD